MLPILCKFRIEKTTDIFQHDSTRFHFLNKTYSLRKQISFILLTQLLGSYRKRGTRHATRKQIHSTIGFAIKIMNISTNNIPMGFIIF